LTFDQSGVYELLDTDGKPMCDEVAEFARVEQSMAQMRIEPAQQAQVRPKACARCACVYRGGPALSPRAEGVGDPGGDPAHGQHAGEPRSPPPAPAV